MRQKRDAALKEVDQLNKRGRNLEQFLHTYLEFYASGRGHTARAKKLDVASFLQFLSQELRKSTSKLTLRDWTHATAQRFVDYRLALGEAPTTVSRRLATLKHIGRTLSERSTSFMNPMHEVKGPKVAPLKPQGIPPLVLKKLSLELTQNSCGRDRFKKLRNAMLFLFLAGTGIRAEEVRTIKLSQFEDSLLWIRNVKTKGRRFRSVYVPSHLHQQLTYYLDARRSELERKFGRLSDAQIKNVPLFISTYRAEISRPESLQMGSKSVWRAINAIGKEYKLHPHLLRHTFALELLDATGDIRLVAQALGHSDVRVTMRYTERNDEDIASALERKNIK
jgi:integrase/recombinase XerC